MQTTKLSVLSLILMLPVILSGCLVTSLHPLYTGNDVVYNEELTGSWKNTDGDDTWLFEEKSDRSYRLSISDEKSTGKFEAHLVSLDDNLFLDLFPEEPENAEEGAGNQWYYLHLVPTHSFMAVSIEGDSLRLGLLQPDWFKDKIDQGTDIDVKFEVRDDDRYLLTDSTEGLQRFLLEHGNDKDFYKLYSLYRLKENE